MDALGQQLHPPPLERLPLHIFECICRDVPKRSLFYLSLASKLCCQASTPGRLSRVRLEIVDKEKRLSDLH